MLTSWSPVACSCAPAAISATTLLISATCAHDALERLAGFGDQFDAVLDLRGRGRDQALDLLGGVGRALGERAHFGGDDREAAAGVAGARRLDAGVERQQIGLEGDLVDHADDLADLLRGFGDRVHRLDRLAHDDGALLGVARRRSATTSRAWLAPSADFFTSR